MAKVKRPESVLAVIYTSDRQILLLKRRLPPAGVWQSVTASLQWGETPMQAARREVFEETGLQVGEALCETDVVNRFEIVSDARPLYAPGVVENTEYVFNLELPAVSAIRLDPAEHSEYSWQPVDRALDMVWSRTNRQAIIALPKKAVREV